MTKIIGTSREDRYTFLIISRSVLLRMRNMSDKFVEKIKTHILCAMIPPHLSLSKNPWRNTVVPYGSQMMVQHMHIACWIRKATNTHL